MAGRIALAVLGVLIVFVIGTGLWYQGTYNKLVTQSQTADAQWSNVQVQLQRRFDLIPNLVAATQGIFNQERAVFEAIAEARTRYAGATSPDQQAQAATQVESALARLLVIIENYPELRSQQNVTQLMDELAGTENRISVERGRYNTTVLTYNNTVLRFPGSFVAGMSGFDRRAYFNAAPGTEVPPTVQFR